MYVGICIGKHLWNGRVCSNIFNGAKINKNDMESIFFPVIVAHMLPIGSTFAPLNHAPMRLENHLEEHLIETPPKLNYAKVNHFKLPNFGATNINP